MAAPGRGEKSTDTVFDVFADLRAQITHALKSLASMGVPELGVAYATGQDTALAQAAVRQAAQEQSVKVQRVHSAAQLTQPIVLFVGEPQNCMLLWATEIASRAAVLRDCAGRRQSAGAGADGQPAKAGVNHRHASRSSGLGQPCPWYAPPRSAGPGCTTTPSPQGLAGLLQRGTRRRCCNK